MRNIEIILNYFDNRLTPAEKKAFLKEIGNDPELAEEFETVKNILELARKELKEEVSDIHDKDEVIANVMASYAIDQYHGRRQSGSDEELKKIIAESVIQGRKPSGAKTPEKNSSSSNKTRFLKFALPLAAAIAIMLVVFLPGRDALQLAEAFYYPQEDNYLKDHVIVTRSEQGLAVSAFHQADFNAAWNYFLSDSSLWTENPWTKMYFAISSYETGHEEDAIKNLLELTEHMDYNISTSARWYVSLIYIKQKKYLNAIPFLQKLTEKENRYKQRSVKFLHKIQD